MVSRAPTSCPLDWSTKKEEESGVHVARSSSRVVQGAMFASSVSDFMSSLHSLGRVRVGLERAKLQAGLQPGTLLLHHHTCNTCDKSLVVNTINRAHRFTFDR